eukprot:m.113624 g.113624  ORF g.113624 m.113624 type:complete len:250 (-) comp17091_c0_seq1:93-842(-)
MSVSTPQQAPSIVNLDYLRSGSEFSPETRRKKMVAAAQARGEDSRKHRNTRLEEFYKSTLRPHITSSCGKNEFEGCSVRSQTDCAAAKDLDAWDGFSMTSNSGADEARNSIVNLDFLRSGKEFVDSQDTNSINPPIRNRNARLDEFYKRTLDVHQGASAASADNGQKASDDFGGDLDCWDGMPSPTMVDTSDATQPTSVVNMQFLRSGAEFADPAAVKAVESESRPRTGSKNARLEAFHQRTLAAFENK